MRIKLILSVCLLFTLVITPTLAAPKKEGQNGLKNFGQEKKQEQSQIRTQNFSVTTSPTITQPPENDDMVSPPVVTTNPCDPAAQWKNHGEYVSCVARLHLGGKVTSDAARSEIGKKKVKPTESWETTPTVSPSGNPSVTPPVSGPEPKITVSPIRNIYFFFENFRHFFRFMFR